MTEMVFREPFRTLLDGHPTPREVTVARTALPGLGELTDERRAELLASIGTNAANRIAYGSPSEPETVLANANSHVILRRGPHE